MLTDLPLQWHREHHSGDSIDKINRATNSLATYFDMTFEVLYMLFSLNRNASDFICVHADGGMGSYAYDTGRFHNDLSVRQSAVKAIFRAEQNG